MHAAQPCTIVDTGLTKYHHNRNEIASPKPAEPFFGQEAQFQGAPPSYKDNGDGTVIDAKKRRTALPNSMAHRLLG